MDAKELRIGNFVYLSNGKENTIDLTDFADEFEYLGEIIPSFKPIQLTEDWLIKFGFILDVKNPFNWFDINDVSISFVENRMVKEYGDSYNQFEIPKYVHQLQNLYFALTGEELTLKD